MKNILQLAMLLGVLGGCSHGPYTQKPDKQNPDSLARLEQVLDSQSSETKSRYPYRNPLETLRFFDIKPGMTVVEVLPGGGWYSQILAPYLGNEGKLIGIDYPLPIFANFDFATPEFMEKRKSWPAEWVANRADWGGENAAELEAYPFDGFPARLNGTVDSVLFIRALHNLARYEEDGQYLSDALSVCHDLLKPGGTIGIVQHAAPDSASDDWADGSRGYLKTEWIKSQLEKAGFEFVDSSTVNANPGDQPGEADSVWRLPPSLATSQNDEMLKAQYLAVGETNRMTLLFRKPR